MAARLLFICTLSTAYVHPYILPMKRGAIMDKARLKQHERLYKSKRVDPYQTEERTQGLFKCEQCGAFELEGRWVWENPAEHNTADSTTCPACRRINNQAPAGTILMTGSFVMEHREEITNLIRNTESAEKQTHALERLIDIQEQDDGLMVLTTGEHLANRIGHALKAAYKGETSYTYSDRRTHLAVDWHRD